MEEIYNIILRKGVNYDAFWEDMETITNKDGVPNRKVDVANRRQGSLRQTWYYLTEEEVEEVKNHLDVLEVEKPPEYRDDISMGMNAIQEGNFDKTPTTYTGKKLNWGIIRCAGTTNIFEGNDEVSGSYAYHLDGTGVDIVIQDSGVEPTHPEWEDINGTSRYQSIDWAEASGLDGSFTQNANHDRDYDGHGTHVAGTAAGKTFGWARNAKIYSQKLSGLEGSGDSNTGISVTYAFDAIKLWHRNKSIDPNTGFKRPTVVNMSWGYRSTHAGGTTSYSVDYRGTIIPSVTIQNDYGNDLKSFGLNKFDNTLTSSQTWYFPVRVSSVDTDIEELIEEGVHVVIASGNANHKIDLPGGTDYDNRVNMRNSGYRYYHRGSSPYHLNAILVGAISILSDENDNYKDKRASFSNHGPGIDIYAPGDNIFSSVSNTNRFTDGEYFYNSSYKQTILDGTSMASPQVAGVLACMLQNTPGMTPEKAKEYLIEQSSKDQVRSVDPEPLSSSLALQGSPNRYLFMPQSEESSLKVSDGFNFSGDISFE